MKMNLCIFKLKEFFVSTSILTFWDLGLQLELGAIKYIKRIMLSMFQSRTECH